MYVRGSQLNLYECQRRRKKHTSLNNGPDRPQTECKFNYIAIWSYKHGSADKVLQSTKYTDQYQIVRKYFIFIFFYSRGAQIEIYPQANQIFDHTPFSYIF